MAETATVCLAGCGREADETTAREMKLLLERTRGTVVLDAGGLCSLAAEKQAMRPAAGRLIVTPHPGEMARLAHTSVQQVLGSACRNGAGHGQTAGRRGGAEGPPHTDGHAGRAAVRKPYRKRGPGPRRQRRCAGRDDCRLPRRAWPRRRQPCAAFICTASRPTGARRACPSRACCRRIFWQTFARCILKTGVEHAILLSCAIRHIPPIHNRNEGLIHE